MLYFSVCKPDVVLHFDTGRIEDASGNGYKIYAEKVTPYNKAAYFNGDSKIVIPPFKPVPYDEGVTIIKMKFRYESVTKITQATTLLCSVNWRFSFFINTKRIQTLRQEYCFMIKTQS